MVPGGLAAFKVLDEEVKQHYRELAIKKIRDDSAASGKAAVVAGHYMFWDDEAQEFPTPVSTPADWDTYTHIVYLRIPTGVVTQRRRDDTKRQRPAVSEDHLGRWMQTEHTELQKMCLEHGENNELLDRAEMLLRDFRVHSEAYNLYRAKRELGEQLADVARGNAGLWQTALVFDADRTLTEEDTGRMFWDKEDPLKAIFSSHLGYSYTAFRQATLLYEGEASSNCQDDFDQTCNLVADAVKVYPELANLISQAAGKEHVLVVVLTCGPVHVWRKILARLGSHIVVIGGGRIADGFVVDPEMKATLVRHIRAAGCPHVWAFGDSPLDLPMLREADEGGGGGRRPGEAQPEHGGGARAGDRQRHAGTSGADPAHNAAAARHLASTPDRPGGRGYRRSYFGSPWRQRRRRPARRPRRRPALGPSAGHSDPWTPPSGAMSCVPPTTGSAGTSRWSWCRASSDLGRSACRTCKVARLRATPCVTRRY